MSSDLTTKNLCEAYKEILKDEGMLDGMDSNEYLEQNNIVLNWDDKTEHFTVKKDGQSIIMFRYTLVDAFADVLSCNDGADTILFKLLASTSEIYGINGITLSNLNTVFKEKREVLLESLPPIIQEELDKIRFSEKIKPVEDTEHLADWRQAKSPEEVAKLEKEFAEMELAAQDNDCFIKEGDTLIWVGPNRSREEKIAVYESYKNGRTYDVSEEEVAERDKIEVKKEDAECEDA